MAHTARPHTDKCIKQKMRVPNAVTATRKRVGQGDDGDDGNCRTLRIETADRGLVQRQQRGRGVDHSNEYTTTSAG
jgi:hypothetical protein